MSELPLLYVNQSGRSKIEVPQIQRVEAFHFLWSPKREWIEMMVKVGPHGWEFGKAWRDKGQSMLTHIFLSYGCKWICSIQTACILFDKLHLSDKHGGNGTEFKTVEIDYPSEFLTGIRGYYGTDTGRHGLKALTFETNRRKLGPFGQEEGIHFCIQMGTKQCFGGFHGSSDSFMLYSIGVYVKPINPLEDSILRTEEPLTRNKTGRNIARTICGGERTS